ncbi:hypothetical protein ACFQKF_20335 [Halalkalicoccus sp. GCM10025322]|uniref:hypothetical protein n=2 Tax=Halococcaceae TaxID=1963270 RepID=UPI002F96B878
MRYIRNNTIGIRPDLTSMTSKRWGAAALATISGSVHLYLYATQSFIPFLLAGLGFLTLAGLLATTFDHRLLYVGGIPFTLAQIAAWIQLGMPDFALGVADKTVQVALICLLAYLFVSERRSKTVDADIYSQTSDTEIGRAA